MSSLFFRSRPQPCHNHQRYPQVPGFRNAFPFTSSVSFFLNQFLSEVCLTTCNRVDTQRTTSRVSHNQADLNFLSVIWFEAATLWNHPLLVMYEASENVVSSGEGDSSGPCKPSAGTPRCFDCQWHPGPDGRQPTRQTSGFEPMAASTDAT
jgi:hypothetical protein